MTEDQARLRVIRAMCPGRVCRTCGEPSRRIVEQTNEAYAANAAVIRTAKAPTDGRRKGFYDQHADDPPEVRRAQSRRENGVVKPEYSTVGFTDCGHDDWRPGVVLDPFQKTEEGVMLTLGNINEK